VDELQERAPCNPTIICHPSKDAADRAAARASAGDQLPCKHCSIHDVIQTSDSLALRFPEHHRWAHHVRAFCSERKQTRHAPGRERPSSPRRLHHRAEHHRARHCLTAAHQELSSSSQYAIYEHHAPGREGDRGLRAGWVTRARSQQGFASARHELARSVQPVQQGIPIARVSPIPVAPSPVCRSSPSLSQRRRAVAQSLVAQ
jgi:hypothetical protein